MPERDLIVYVDIDDTLVRNCGSKRIPMISVIEHIRQLKQNEAILYAWSTAGAEYAQKSAKELGILECFTAFLPKPHVLIDDQLVGEWRLVQVHPNSCPGETSESYKDQIVRNTFNKT